MIRVPNGETIRRNTDYCDPLAVLLPNQNTDRCDILPVLLPNQDATVSSRFLRLSSIDQFQLLSAGRATDRPGINLKE